MFTILAINPGSSSTKMSVFEDGKNTLSLNLPHPAVELEALHGFMDQFEFRKAAIQEALKEHHINIESFSAVVGRGGLMHPVESGAYRVNEAMKKDLQQSPKYHASNLGAMLADDLANMAGVPALVYDPVSVDELGVLTRLTGIPGVERASVGHVLNMRAVARTWAETKHRGYEEVTLIVAHLGGGITLSLHQMGRIVDLISDDEGPFGPERSGLIPGRKLIAYIYENNLDEQQAFDALQGTGAGLYGLLGTPNTIEVEERIAAGDKKALLCYESMAFNVAKAIGQLATEVYGKVDAIILTGGTANSKLFTGWIKDRTSFVAPVEVMPGEREMEAMAAGALRVLQGKEKVKTYTGGMRPMLLK